MGEKVPNSVTFLDDYQVSMVLAGKKTLMRMPIDPQPEWKPSPPNTMLADGWAWSHGSTKLAHWPDESKFATKLSECNPLGSAGEHLLVRESLRHVLLKDSTCAVQYRADNAVYQVLAEDGGEGDYCGIGKRVQNSFFNAGKWLLPKHMPYWAPRIRLKIVNVIAQRVQAISASEALAEGISGSPFWNPREVEGSPFEEKWWDDFHFWCNYPQLVYKKLWDHTFKNWDDNPWTWVVKFAVEHTPAGRVTP